MITLEIQLITRIAVLKHSLKSTGLDFRDTVEATLIFNLDVFKALTGKDFSDEEFKKLPLVREFKCKRAYKDTGVLYYELLINRERFDKFFSSKEAKETVKAIIEARKSEYTEKVVEMKEEVAHA